jgi:hypothetical protein
VFVSASSGCQQTIPIPAARQPLDVSRLTNKIGFICRVSLKLCPTYTLSFYSMGHDPSATIFEDGELTFGVEQERFSRSKHAVNEFPTAAIEACLSWHDIDMGEVDTVVIPNVLSRHVRHDARKIVSDPSKRRLRHFAQSVKDYFLLEEEIRDELASLGQPVPLIETVSHHKPTLLVPTILRSLPTHSSSQSTAEVNSTPL